MNTIEDPKTFFLKVLNFIILIVVLLCAVFVFIRIFYPIFNTDWLIISPLLLLIIGYYSLRGLKEIFTEKAFNPLLMQLLVFCFLALYLLNAFNGNLINNYDEWVDFAATLYWLFSFGFVSSFHYKQNKLIPFFVSLIALVAIYFLGMKEKFENRYEGWSIVQVADNEEYLATDYSELSKGENLYWSVRYSEGEGIPKNDIKAFNHLLSASKKGHLIARKYLALRYYFGRGTSVDYLKAFAWLNALKYDSRFNEYSIPKEQEFEGNDGKKIKIKNYENWNEFVSDIDTKIKTIEDYFYNIGTIDEAQDLAASYVEKYSQ